VVTKSELVDELARVANLSQELSEAITIAARNS
jgi:hypothetical protein